MAKVWWRFGGTLGEFNENNAVEEGGVTGLRLTTQQEGWGGLQMTYERDASGIVCTPTLEELAAMLHGKWDDVPRAIEGSITAPETDNSRVSFTAGAEFYGGGFARRVGARCASPWVPFGLGTLERVTGVFGYIETLGLVNEYDAILATDSVFKPVLGSVPSVGTHDFGDAYLGDNNYPTEIVGDIVCEVDWDVDGDVTTHKYTAPFNFDSGRYDFPPLTDPPQPIFKPDDPLAPHSVRMRIRNPYMGTASPWIPLPAYPMPRIALGAEDYKHIWSGRPFSQLPEGNPQYPEGSYGPLTVESDEILRADDPACPTFNFAGREMIYRWSIFPSFYYPDGSADYPEGPVLGYGPTLDITRFTDKFDGTHGYFIQLTVGTLYTPRRGRSDKELFLYPHSFSEIGVSIPPDPDTTDFYVVSVIFIDLRYEASVDTVLDAHNVLYFYRKEPRAEGLRLNFFTNYNRAHLSGSELRSYTYGSAARLDYDAEGIKRLVKRQGLWWLSRSFDEMKTWEPQIKSPLNGVLYPQQDFVSLGDGRMIVVGKGNSDNAGQIVSATRFSAGGVWEPVVTITTESTGKSVQILPEQIAGSANVLVTDGVAFWRSTRLGQEGSWEVVAE